MSAPPPGAETAGNPARGLVLAVIGLSLLLLLGTIGLVSRAALDAFEAEVRPELEKEAEVIGGTVAGPIQRALSLGVPFADLTGVEDFFDSVLSARPTVEYLVLTDADGRIAHRAGRGAGHFVPPSGPLPRAGNAPLMRSLPDGYDAAQPLQAEGGTVGWLHVGLGRAALDTAARDTRWDIAIVLLVSLLTTVELLRFVVERTVSTPLLLVHRMMRRLVAGDWTARAASTAGDEAGRLAREINALVRRMNDRWRRLEWLAGEVSGASEEAARRARATLAEIAARFRFSPDGTALERMPPGPAVARLPLFLFVFAEQLSTSFIPLYSGELGGSSGVLAAVPITAFVAAVALATPYGGRLVARRGARNAILIGAVPAALGHLGSALAGSVAEFALARAVCGMGYAVVTIACQAHLAQIAQQGRLARSLGGFTGAVMTGALCGTAIGAVIADRIGYRATFVVSVLLVLAVQFLAWRRLEANARSCRASGSVWRDAGMAFRSPSFVALVLLAAIPAKVLLAGFIFYLAPIELKALGLSQAAIGRNVMLYALAMLPAIVLGGWLSDKARWEVPLIWLAGIANGLGLLLPLVAPPDLALPAAIALTGIAQGFAAAPMLALVPQIAAGPGAGPGTPVLLAFLRLGERVGSVVGPLVAAWLLLSGGASWAMVVLGLLSIITAVGYAVVQAFGRSSTAREAGA